MAGPRAARYSLIGDICEPTPEGYVETRSECEMGVEGYSLIGDICEPTPEGYVETRSECEMGVDSREAAGVEQDYQAELEKCRNAGPPVP